MVTKSEIKKFQGSFIPPKEIREAERVSLQGKVFRRTKEHEVYRCAVGVGHDLQSGPLYCGALCEWICDLGNDHFLISCNRHTPLINREKDN